MGTYKLDAEEIADVMEDNQKKDPFDRFFYGYEIKNKLNPMEKKKLSRLDKEAEDCFKECDRLEKERTNMRKNLVPNHKQELNELKQERDRLLQIKTEEARQIKEDRKQIRRDFSQKTQHIREARREQLNSDLSFEKNKKEKNEMWDKHQLLRNEFHKYWEHLLKKYREAHKNATEDKK